MRKNLLYICLVISFICYSQCPPLDFVTFNSQAEIDAFATNYPNCTELEGISVEGSDISNLNGLSKIESTIKLYTQFKFICC